MIRKRRAQDLYSVTAVDSVGSVLHEITCNTYLLPGVLWALKSVFPGATVTDRFMGKGHLVADEV